MTHPKGTISFSFDDDYRSTVVPPPPRVNKLTEAEQDAAEREYDWDRDFPRYDRSAVTCNRCDAPVDYWYRDVPCCGGEFTCTDELKVYACHGCRLVADSW